MRRREFALLAGPCLLVMVGLLVVPLVQTIGWSFQNVSYGEAGTFVGFANYTEALGSSRFLRAVAFTFALTFVALVLKLVVGYALALMLNALRRGRSFLLGLLFVTYVVPTVVGAILFSWLFNNTFGGLVNWVLGHVGVQVSWLSSVWPARALILMQVVWHELAFPLIVLLAGLRGLSQDQVEASRIDGTNWFQRQWYVVLPNLRNLITFIILVGVMDGLRIFDAIRVITPAAQTTGTESIMTYVYDVALGQGQQLGLGSAISVLTVLLTVVLLLPVIRNTYSTMVAR